MVKQTRIAGVDASSASESSSNRRRFARRLKRALDEVRHRVNMMSLKEREELDKQARRLVRKGRKLMTPEQKARYLKALLAYRQHKRCLKLLKNR